MSDIYPLRDTYFEGEKAKVPYSYNDILIEEYKTKALTATTWESHRWNPKQKAWLYDPSAARRSDHFSKAPKPKVIPKPDPKPKPVAQDLPIDHGIFYNLLHWFHTE